MIPLCDTAWDRNDELPPGDRVSQLEHGPFDISVVAAEPWGRAILAEPPASQAGTEVLAARKSMKVGQHLAELVPAYVFRPWTSPVRSRSPAFGSKALRLPRISRFQTISNKVPAGRRRYVQTISANVPAGRRSPRRRNNVRCGRCEVQSHSALRHRRRSRKNSVKCRKLHQKLIAAERVRNVIDLLIFIGKSQG